MFMHIIVIGRINSFVHVDDLTTLKIIQLMHFRLVNEYFVNKKIKTTFLLKMIINKYATFGQFPKPR